MSQSGEKLTTEEEKKQLFLCFESSCDDTSVALAVGGRTDEIPKILSWSIQSQNEVHQKFGGVVPELASRAHLHNLIPCIEKVLEETGYEFSDIDYFAATSKPGLIGSLLIGHTAAKTLSLLYNKDFLSCHHLEGHLLSIFLEHQPKFPFLALIVSGGHTSLYLVEDYDQFKSLGVTLDDAAGEAFDKGAKLLGLGFPGGAELEKLAAKASSCAYSFPKKINVAHFDFSFSGIKSELARLVAKEKNQIMREEAAFGYQEAIVDHLLDKLIKAVSQTKVSELAIVGGVAQNKYLQANLQKLVSEGLLESYYSPSPSFCTDNAAMIALVAFRKWKKGEFSSLEADVGVSMRPKRKKKASCG